MTALAVLIRARLLIERGWCQQASALTPTGAPVSPRSISAASWDIVGATIRAASDLLGPGAYSYVVLAHPARVAALERLAAALTQPKKRAKDMGFQILASWNDEPARTSDEVLALFDGVIAALEKEKKTGEEPFPSEDNLPQTRR